MRYLLYPTETLVKSLPKVSKQLSKKNVALGKKQVPAVIPSCVVHKNDTSVDNGLNSSSTASDHPQSSLAWGQQCSPTCGCVVRFEAKLSDDKAGTIEQVSYHAKKLVTTTNKANGTLQVHLTSKGRPMFEECSCKSLHHISQATMEHMMKQKTLAQFKHSLQFQKTRSSPAFCRNALQTQGLPSTDTHCLDVVEEAVTALCKGHMPMPRRQSVAPAVQVYSSTTIEQNHPSQPAHAQIQQFVDRNNAHGEMEEEDDHYHFLKFGHSLRDDASSSSRGTRRHSHDETWFSAVLDSLGWWPETPAGSNSMTKVVLASKQEALLPSTDDWISYVDKIQEQQEQQQDEQQTSVV